MAAHEAAFSPHPLLCHPHLMTIASRLRRRTLFGNDRPAEARLFRVASDSRILGHCHWQPSPKKHPTLLLLHGFEGCSGSHYMLGIAAKAWRLGCNVVRLNQRNCGGTEHLTPTLYHAGLSEDVAAVASELTVRDGLESLWLAGYSMGGNLVLKAAGEAGTALPSLRGVVAVCPNIDPAACVAALEHPSNWFYQRYFLSQTKARLRRKALLFPDTLDLSNLDRIATLSQFDDAYTAPDGGFRSAADYYERVGARHVLADIRVPTLLIASQDDPFIPFSMFDHPAVTANGRIRLLATRRGGHCGFVQRPRRDEDCYWAENRLVEFICTEQGPVQEGAKSP